MSRVRQRVEHPHAWPSLGGTFPLRRRNSGRPGPATRPRAAGRCATCHVGSPADGKFVTHEMYAAGHPPLPPLEVMTFSRDQPMHYKLPKDLPYFRRRTRKKRGNCSTTARANRSRPGWWPLVRSRRPGRPCECWPRRPRRLTPAPGYWISPTSSRRLPSHLEAAQLAKQPATPATGPAVPNTGPLALLRVVLAHGAAAAPALKSVADELRPSTPNSSGPSTPAHSATRPRSPPPRGISTWADSAEKGLEWSSTRPTKPESF